MKENTPSTKKKVRLKEKNKENTLSIKKKVRNQDLDLLSTTKKKIKIFLFFFYKFPPLAPPFVISHREASRMNHRTALLTPTQLIYCNLAALHFSALHRRFVSSIVDMPARIDLVVKYT